MGIISDPTCIYCENALETAAHFLCECSHFVTQRQEIWGKSYLHPSEADTVQNHTYSHNTLVHIIRVLLGMAYGPTPQSRPAGLYKPCPLLECNGTSLVCIACVFVAFLFHVVQFMN